MQKIAPFLWFDNQAEEAVDFYTAIFKNPKVGKVMRCGEGGSANAQSGTRGWSLKKSQTSAAVK